MARRLARLECAGKDTIGRIRGPAKYPHQRCFGLSSEPALTEMEEHGVSVPPLLALLKLVFHELAEVTSV